MRLSSPLGFAIVPVAVGFIRWSRISRSTRAREQRHAVAMIGGYRSGCAARWALSWSARCYLLKSLRNMRCLEPHGAGHDKLARGALHSL